jgi:hypothetical protein
VMAEESPYANHHIDLDVFRRLGPFVDWRRILDQHLSGKIDLNGRAK